jgi:hypothetical protein
MVNNHNNQPGRVAAISCEIDTFGLARDNVASPDQAGPGQKSADRFQMRMAIGSLESLVLETPELSARCYR